MHKCRVCGFKITDLEWRSFKFCMTNIGCGHNAFVRVEGGV